MLGTRGSVWLPRATLPCQQFIGTRGAWPGHCAHLLRDKEGKGTLLGPGAAVPATLAPAARPLMLRGEHQAGISAAHLEPAEWGRKLMLLALHILRHVQTLLLQGLT